MESLTWNGHGVSSTVIVGLRSDDSYFNLGIFELESNQNFDKYLDLRYRSNEWSWAECNCVRLMAAVNPILRSEVVRW